MGIVSSPLHPQARKPLEKARSGRGWPPICQGIPIVSALMDLCTLSSAPPPQQETSMSLKPNLNSYPWALAIGMHSRALENHQPPPHPPPATTEEKTPSFRKAAHL